MFSTLVSVLLALTGVAVLLHRIGMWATWRYLARNPEPTAADGALPPITLLKPIKGLEDGLEANLRSFFEQDYPGAIQIVFTSTAAHDPGMAIARRIALEYPQVESAFVHARDDFGLNPKVANMQGGLQAGRHDLLLQSDANVRLHPGYLRALVGYMQTQEPRSSAAWSSAKASVRLRRRWRTCSCTAFTAPGVCMAKSSPTSRACSASRCCSSAASSRRSAALRWSRTCSPRTTRSARSTRSTASASR